MNERETKQQLAQAFSLQPHSIRLRICTLRIYNTSLEGQAIQCFYPG